jgi:hypothetical protein
MTDEEIGFLDLTTQKSDKRREEEAGKYALLIKLQT